MPSPKPVPLELSDEERQVLTGWTRRRTTAQALALRSRIVLECAKGRSNSEVAASVAVSRETVRKWRSCFVRDRVEGLTPSPHTAYELTTRDTRGPVAWFVNGRAMRRAFWHGSFAKLSSTCHPLITVGEPPPGDDRWVVVEKCPAVGVLTVGRRVTSLAILGDSTGVGLGDPLPAAGWRGFGPLLVAALGAPGEVRYRNLSVIGARMADLRHRQLPGALAVQPDIAVIVAGMNDTLRSDFNPGALRDDLTITVAALQATGAVVLITRFHDHGQVFWLPGPLRRALYDRVAQLNDAIDQVVGQRGALCLDLHQLPGAYDCAAWSVDRLHPSERGHRLLAGGFAALLTAAGITVPHPVDLTCAGGRKLTAAHHIAWLICRGVPWLVRRGRDLLPHAAAVLARDLVGRLRQQPVS